jgi:predicted small secreted protein
MKRAIKLTVLTFLASMLLTGCLQTMKTNPIGAGLRSVDWLDDSGKVTRSYFEMLDPSGSWYEAENVNGQWSLTPAGNAKKNAGSGSGGGGGGGGRC